MSNVSSYFGEKLAGSGITAARSLIGEYARLRPRRAVAVVVSQIVNAFLESVGILALIPALAMLVQSGAVDNNVTRLTHAAFVAVGMQPSLNAALLLLVALTITKFLAKTAIAVIHGDYFSLYTQELRMRMVVGTARARTTYLFHKSSGALANTLGDLITQYDIAMKAAFGFLARLIQVLFYITAAILVSWWLTLSALLISLIIAVVLYPSGLAIRKASFQKTVLMNELLALFVETAQGLKPLRAMGRVPTLINAFRKRFEKYRHIYLKEVFAAAIRINAPEAILVVAIAAALFWAQSNPQHGVVDLAVMLVILARTAAELNSLLSRLQQVLANEGAVATVRDELKAMNLARETTTGTIQPVFDRAIQFDNVTLAYGDNILAAHVNLTFEARRLHVLTGPSGVGKTSLCDAIIGLLEPRSGRITVDNVALSDLDLGAWREMIGYVPQDPFMFNDTIRANLTIFDPEISDDDIWRALEASESKDVIEALPDGLDTILGERGMRMSGGQRQRLSIARALVRGPKLLVLDEATAALDIETERAIAQTLQRLTKLTTIIAISHQSCLPEYANHVVNFRKDAIEGATIVSELSSEVARPRVEVKV